jgi:AraC-like DNA-binding protein
MTETSVVDRAEVWRSDLARAFGRLAAEAHGPAQRAEPGHGLDGSMREARLGRLGVFSVRGTPQVVRRTAPAIAAAPADPLKVCIQVAGTTVVHQAGREVMLQPGQLAIYDTGRPYDLRLSGAWTCAVVTIPREALEVADHVLSAAMHHAFAVHDGPGALLVNLADFALAQADVDADDPCRAHLGEAGIEMIAGLIDASAVASAAPDTSSSERAVVLSYVRTHLRDADLSHASVAAAHHMSPRTLNRLFEAEERTVSEAIRSMRLEAVRCELEDPRWRRSPVMVVAARWGFRDQGHFTRAFKKEFGTAPGAYRRKGLSA